MNKFKENMTNLYEAMLDGRDIHDVIKLSPEQINHILELYEDPDYVIGFHNTSFPNPESFFNKGVLCQNFLGKNTNDLTNTVYFENTLLPLFLYPSGYEQDKNMCVIYRFPKEVFEQNPDKRAGLFEITDNGRYTITPKYITSAFVDGQIINNPIYDGNYRSNNAILIDDENTQLYKYRTTRTEDIEFFKEYYYGKSNIFQKMKDKFLSIFNRKDKTKLIPESFSAESSKNNHKQFASKLAVPNLGNNTFSKSIHPTSREVHKASDRDSHEL